ncbi:hypothetical protein ACFO1B_21135 [Dactylosporangium siamense]|uniref:Uncharacterized protein n=1 Tax=Dactylosporangium siamense TaxID=685454 RepID=A0A919PNA7_9ACTN|nr:hypothetical protein [Dactylosporangium siamense]GIG46757.1 hypothetical protein Dsi01nite_047980 [Dactylosporangium siamense]
MDVQSWERVLLQDVLDRGRPGERLYLYVDRELLGRLSGMDPADAVADFCNAVRSSEPGRPFVKAALAASRWRDRHFSGPPGFVAALALTVLAVTEVPLGGSNGIYRRQNELLGRPPTPTEPPGYRDHVPGMWAVWNEWLDGPGAAYGRSSARNHGRWTLQGWSRSQGLIRHIDRIRIEQFLSDTATARSRSPLAAEFVEWLRYRGSAGADLLARFADDAAMQVVQDVLDDESERLRRDGRRPTVHRGSRAMLHYDDWLGEFGGAVAVDPTWYGLTLDLGDDEPYVAGPFDTVLVLRAGVPDGDVLGSGVELELADRVTVTFGGEDAYVMADDPAVSGRVQCRTVTHPSLYHVLVRDAHLHGLARTLRADGIDRTAKPSVVPGWSWLENVPLEPGAQILSAVGLTAAVPGPPSRSRLDGGLQVAHSTYLTGGEPDFVIDSDAALPGLTLDGARLPVTPGQRRVSLADQRPAPGTHRVASDLGDRTFVTMVHQQDRARAGDIWRSVTLTSTGLHFSEPTRMAQPDVGLAGAVLRGASLPPSITVRRPPGTECLVVTDEGDVSEVWPSAPPWLRAIGVEPHFVNVMQAVRTLPAPPAFFVVRSGRRHVAHVVEIPLSTPQLPGRVPSQPRPNLVGELFTGPGPQSSTADARFRSALSKAILRKVATRGDYPPSCRPTAMRDDVQQGPRVDNPYDDVLTWLSERERGRASQSLYAETWAWACARYGHADMGGAWRKSLGTLMSLGFIERDYARQEVAIAPAALSAIPSSVGVFVLTGARPRRLLERMDDPNDPDASVAAAVDTWVLHLRTAVDATGHAAGPTTVYVECETADNGVVQAGLSALGVTLQGDVGTHLLEGLPSLRQLLVTGTQLTLSPGREPRLRAMNAGGVWVWAPRNDDRARGLYCYPIRGRRSFAWRTEPDGALVAVDADAGEWLARLNRGQSTLLAYDPLGKKLVVRGGLQPPALLHRALCLRTGLPAYMMTSGGLGAYRWVYENVDNVAAERTADLLGQTLQYTHRTMRTAS